MGYNLWNFHNELQNGRADVKVILPSEYQLWNINKYLEIFYINEDKSITNNNIPIIKDWILESIINKNGGKIYRYLLDPKFGMNSYSAFWYGLKKKIDPIMTECSPKEIMNYMMKGYEQLKVSDEHSTLSDTQKAVLVRKFPESDAYLPTLENPADSMPTMKPLTSWFRGFYTYGGSKRKRRKTKKSNRKARKTKKRRIIK